MKFMSMQSGSHEHAHSFWKVRLLSYHEEDGRRHILDYLGRSLQASRPAALIIRSSGSMRLSLGWQYLPEFCSSMTSCHSSQLTLVHYIVPQQVWKCSSRHCCCHS